MKNGQLPDHWQLWLWIGLAALLLAALARQSAIDTGGMSGFNANLVFIGVIVVIGLLYMAFKDIFPDKKESAIVAKIDKLFRKLGFQPREVAPVVETKPEQIEQKTATTAELQAVNIEPETQVVDSNIVKIETPTPKKIVIDYEGRREQAKKQQDDRAYEKEEHVILYVGYTLSPFVDKHIVEKVIDAVTSFIHTQGVPEFFDDEAIDLPDTLTTTDMMHFGWNIAKPFKKSNPHTAHFLKQVFAQKFKDVEVCTIERKLKSNGSQGNIKINENVARFEIPSEDEPVGKVEPETPQRIKKTIPQKVTKVTKSSKRSKSANPAMMAALADMELEPYSPGDSILDDDGYGYY